MSLQGGDWDWSKVCILNLVCFVQVKSVVVALGRHTTSTETTAPAPEQSTKPSPDDNRGPKCVYASRRGRYCSCLCHHKGEQYHHIKLSMVVLAILGLMVERATVSISQQFPGLLCQSVRTEEASWMRSETSSRTYTKSSCL